MSTRSYIIVKHSDGRLMGQYCHHDGYLSGVGETLRDHYASQDKAEHLSSLGDLSVLDRHPDPLPEAPSRYPWNGDGLIPGADHHFDTPQRGVTIAYGRDRDEHGCKAQNVTHGIIPDVDQEYEYFWDGERWNWRKAKFRERLTMEERTWEPIP